MEIGTCRLCLTPNSELQDSHFIPRSFYKLYIELGHQPINCSPEKSMYSSRQASDYLLCRECEQRFNLGGEKWVRANCYESETHFPLRTALLAAGKSKLSERELTVFESASIPEVDRDKLVYFGVSLFWRATVHQWRMQSGDPVRIHLGPYEEEFRLYLLGKAEFPKNAVILVSVAESTDEMKNKGFTPPWLFRREDGHHQFKMIVQGITYQLMVGQRIQPLLRDMCTLRSPEGRIYMSPETDKRNIEGALGLLKTSRRVGKLAKSDRAIVSDGKTTR